VRPFGLPTRLWEYLLQKSLQGRAHAPWGSLNRKEHSRLYFAGEVLDIDGVTGGFNFQAAWTTAYVVAQAITKSTQV